MNNIEVGKTYTYFDDGKIKPSRKHSVKITHVIPFAKANRKTREQWNIDVLQCYWLYKPSTDYFIYGELDDNADSERVVFVRTLDEGWFSLGFWAGRLDVDGSLLKQMNEYYKEEI